jgi:hypothetical protein
MGKIKTDRKIQEDQSICDFTKEYESLFENSCKT